MKGSSLQRMVNNPGKTSGEDDEDDEKDDSCTTKNTEMQIEESNSYSETPKATVKSPDLFDSEDIDTTVDQSKVIEDVDKSGDQLDQFRADSEVEDKMSVGEVETEPKSEADELNGDLCNDTEGKENCENIEVDKDMSESDVEMEIKRTLKEAVEIRIPKMKSRKDSSEFKWVSTSNGDLGRDRPETPPLQKLMRQDFSPLRSDNVSHHSPPKKMKESSSLKDGFTSKLASVIVPSSSVPLRTASHPKQLLSHSIANLRNSSHKSVYSKNLHSSSSLLSRPYPPSKPLYHHQHNQDEQPLDLSKKTTKDQTQSSGKTKSQKSSFYSHSQENGLSSSSTSLQSLQQKFGGDFHLRGLRKPTNYMLFGPEIPALHQALLHSASMSIPHYPLPMSNGMPKMKSDHSPNFRHHNSTPSPPNKTKQDDLCKSMKKEDGLLEKSMKREKLEKADAREHETEAVTDDSQNEKYTNHMCTCGKWFDSLYSLSLHLQETGHLPARSKSVSLLEYPKLVRGQDMWLNQESEQTRRILRCIQCGESFKTLPMLTVHMMKTQHYTKIVSSEHARRAHKCSAYCDKEQDKECVFKCKVCQESFADMEGLANHMIMSGHHKKQVARSSSQAFNDIQYRQKRKRLYSFEDHVNPYNSAMAAMLEYKRKCMPERISPDVSVEADIDDSTISCENCGRKIETKLFVDHVRACLGQTLAADIRKYKELKERDEELLRKGKSPISKARIESPSNHTSSEKNRVKADMERVSKSPKLEAKDVKDEVDSGVEDNDKSMQVNKKSNPSESTNEQIENNDLDREVKKESLESDVNSDREIHSPVRNTKVNTDYNDEKVVKEEVVDNVNDNSKMESKKTKGIISQNLDIIDPDNLKEDNGSGSALSAMESFIQKSFSNKFDYKKGNIIISPNSSADATVHSRPLSSAMNLDSLDYLSKYKKFYNALNLPNGFKGDKSETDNGSVSGGRVKGSHERRRDQDGLKMKEFDKKFNSGSPLSGSEDKEDGRLSVKSCQSDNSASTEANENIEKKYLNVSEENGEKTEKEKSSALDNLSSFVYGQPMTSEHPLDSLQRLITKADIPKLMVTHGARAFKYLPPHLQFHQSASDLTVPLNLSLKTQNGGESDDDDDKLRPDEDSLSDYDAVSSPTNSDGDPMEYRCAACSRRFASKGSYRYHLSRCHLSSVKRYGIKEAFNMSPYVYLPLDHTAKFSKYYEMAKELANKRK